MLRNSLLYGCETWVIRVVPSVKDGNGGDEDDQVDVWCFTERKTSQHRTEKRMPGCRDWDLGIL